MDRKQLFFHDSFLQMSLQGNKFQRKGSEHLKVMKKQKFRIKNKMKCNNFDLDGDNDLSYIKDMKQWT